MNVKRKNVNVELRTVIEDEGDKELVIVKQKGKYYKRNNLEVLTYTEEMDEGEDVENMISIHPDKINIKRSGAISMNQIFVKGRVTESLYQHPHGNIHMNIDTVSISYESIDETGQGQVIIAYQAMLNGTEERNHYLTLTFTEE